METSQNLHLHCCNTRFDDFILLLIQLSKPSNSSSINSATAILRTNVPFSYNLRLHSCKPRHIPIHKAKMVAHSSSNSHSHHRSKCLYVAKAGMEKLRLHNLRNNSGHSMRSSTWRKHLRTHKTMEGGLK